MKLFSVTILALTILSCSGQQKEIPKKDWQIKTATLGLEEMNRAEATILGFDSDGKVILIKEGTNNFFCLADDPNKEGFSIAAYHKDLEPFMARGRELKEQGKNFKEIFDIREEEVKSGKLQMPDKSTLYVMNGEINDAGEVVNTSLRFVVYIPFATAESTGLPLEPLAPGAPWIMNPGTHRAHIMITPPK